MSAPITFNTRHTLTGKLQRLTEGQIRVFKDHLEIVADDAKPVTPELVQPGTVAEKPKPASKATSGKASRADASTSDDESDMVDPEPADTEGDSQ